MNMNKHWVKIKLRATLLGGFLDCKFIFRPSLSFEAHLLKLFLYPAAVTGLTPGPSRYAPNPSSVPAARADFADISSRVS